LALRITDSFGSRPAASGFFRLQISVLTHGTVSAHRRPLERARPACRAHPAQAARVLSIVNDARRNADDPAANR
jgi:hypothetical protein